LVAQELIFNDGERYLALAVGKTEKVSRKMRLQDGSNCAA
jgi:hypothetical protein